MAQGPPPSDAGPSHSAGQGSVPTALGAGQTYSFSHFQAGTPVSGPSYSQAQPYYNYAWQNPWPYYHPGQAYQQQFPSYPQQYPQTTQQQQPPPVPELKPKSPSPSPPPPPKFKREWDNVIKIFLEKAGLKQALRGFEADMLVMNPDFEKKEIPLALSDLRKNLTRLESDADEATDLLERSLDERKLDSVHLSGNHVPRTPTSINKEISIFLARNRAKNDASNRREFLESLSEKRRRLLGDDNPEKMDVDSIPSCARTDAKPIDRDLQMKYDIAKNEEGPLRKTVKVEPDRDNEAVGLSSTNRPPAGPDITADRYAGLDERLKNIETHFSVRYVPAIPHSLLDRLKFLEDHIIRLEREYPPWAALHFNQPHRGWPPPPRPTPIIVPSHLTRQDPVPLPATQPSDGMPSHAESDVKGKGKASTSSKKKGKESSLHKAVLEKLEVQKAREDLAGRDPSGS